LENGNGRLEVLVGNIVEFAEGLAGLDCHHVGRPVRLFFEEVHQRLEI
jgi:hypothetical protein